MALVLLWTVDATGDTKTLTFDAVTSHTVTYSSTATEHPVETGASVSDHVRPNLDMLSVEAFVSNTPLSEENRINPSAPRGAVQPVNLVYPTFQSPLGPLTPKRLIYPSPPINYNLGSVIRAGLNALFEAGGEYLRYPSQEPPPDPPVASMLQFAATFNAVLETLEALKRCRDTAQRITVMSRDWYLENMVITSLAEPRTAAEGSGAKFAIEFKQIRIVETRTTTAPIPLEPRGKPVKSAGAKGAKEAPPEKKASLLKKLFGGLAP